MALTTSDFEAFQEHQAAHAARQRDEIQICLSRAASSEFSASQNDRQIERLQREALEYRALAERLRARAALLGSQHGSNK